MKQESTKKSKLWLWVTVGIVLLAVIAGTVLALLLGGQNARKPDTSGRAELYWNVDRLVYTEGSESGLSTREPGEDGLYHIRFAIDGEHIELAAADKQLVNFIDMQEVLALSVDSDGLIVDAFDPKEVSTVVGKSLYAKKAEGDKIIVNSSLAMNGMVHELTVTELTQIYEVSGEVEPVGKIVDSSAIQALDTVGIYANGDGVVTHIFIIEHPARSSIYWRAEQYYNSTLKQTSREPDKDGVYTFDAYCDGELVTLKTKDRDIVNTVDRQDRYACSNGFLFDEDGFVVEEIDPGLGTRTVMGCERYDITEIVGNTIYTAKLWNNDGSVFSCEIADDCIIYDVSTAALAEGRRGKQVDSVQLGDRVTVWTNTDGKAAYIYVACRTVDTDIYYVPTRKYDDTLKETTRTPNSEGYYTVELLKAGETANRTFKTKDKALMSYLDSITAKTVGLKLNGDIIETVYDSECLFGYTPLTRGGTIPSVSGSIFTRMTYGKSDSTRTSVMAADCKVYNVSEVGTYGAETTLQPYDRVYAHRKPSGEAICIFVIQRRVGLDHLYWNIERMYDSTAKTTTRQPDADGWYVFQMIHQGKQVTLKTKSKAVATKIDAQSSCAVGLDVSGDVIVRYYSALNTSGGSVTMSGYRVKEIRDDGTVVVYYGSGDTYKERSFKIKSDGVIYNVSDAYTSYRGEKVSSLKLGDMVLVVTDIYAEAEVVFIRYREVDNMYWRTDRYYDTVDKVTTRVPDAEGWYHYDLAVNGKIQSFKTKDKDLATKIDAVSGAFGLVVDGDVIRSYVPTNWVKDVGFVGVTNWEVTAISGSQVTVKYTLPGSSNTGKTQTVTLASGAKIYDVSPTAETFGAAAKLQVGDQIRTYQNEANTAQLYVYILHHANRVQGIDGYCEHCGKTVHWNPYAGGSITRTSGHYYLSGDCKTTEQLGVGLENSDYEIVLDLNGKTLTRLTGGRFALVRYGDTLTVLDSVGGGAIKSYGANGYNGGVMYVDGGNLNLLGGTLELLESDYTHKWGGVLYLGERSVFKMSGGTVAGGTALRGGSIYNTGASLIEMSGGTVTGGRSSEAGGNIYQISESTMKMSGGLISNGYGGTRAGNIYVDSATLEITGGKITGGSSVKSQDGICVNSSKSSVKLADLTCEDKILVRYMGEFVLSGQLKLAELDVPSGKQFTVGEMTEGSEVYVTAVGKFTNAFDNAQAYVDAGYFKTNVEKMEVGVSDNALVLQGEKSYCLHCDQKVAWFLWNADATIEGPSEEGVADHYYLDGDFTNHTAQRTVKGNVVLDLRGNNYTTTGIRNFLVSGNFSVMDSVGGGVMSADGVGNDGSIAYINGDAGVFSLYSGTLKLSENANVTNGGVLAVNRGSVNIYGGQIIGGSVSGNGSAIWNNRYANITVEGGSVTGSVYVVGNDDANAVLNISGGSLDQIVVNSKVDVTLSGAPVIGELDLTGGKPITLGELTDGASITVTATGAFTQENENVADYVEFFQNAEGERPTADNNTLAFGSAQAPEGTLCPHCNEEVAWTQWPATTKPASGHYYIDADFTAQTAQWTISADTDVVLDLRGNDYTTTGIRNFLVSGTLSIVDTVGGGTMCADGSNDDGAIAYINGDDGLFNLYGGTLKQGDAPQVKNGGILAANRGSVGIYGGQILEGTVTGNGSAIWNKRYTTLTVAGGTVDGSIYITGDDEKNAQLLISGGSVSGDILVQDKVDVTVSGAPILSKLDLTGAKPITLGELIQGADITVSAGGVFTNTCTNAQTYKTAGYFKAAGEGLKIVVKDGALAVSDGSQTEDQEQYAGNAVYANAVKMTADGVFDGTDSVVTADCPYCGAVDAQWNVLEGIETKTTLDGTVSHYYLKADLTENASYYSVSGTICLHLNGHTLSSSERVFQVESAGTLNIMGDGTVCGSYSSTNASYATFASTLDVIGEANLCGGTYTRADVQPIITGRATLNDGESRNINIYTGTTVQGDAQYTGSACVYLSNSHIFNLYGGTVTGGNNPTGNGGNIALVAGTYRNRVAQINLYGGTVENGVAAKGGNIYLGGANKKNSKGTCTGVLNIAGGTVTGGTADSGADVYICGNTQYEILRAQIGGGTVGSVFVEAGTESFTLSGKPVIENLELASGALVVLGEMEADASVTVNAADGAFTAENTKAADYAAYFKAAVAGKTVKAEDNVLMIADATALQSVASFFSVLWAVML